MYQNILDFWFHELTPDQHWQKSDELDLTIKTRFGDWQQKAARGELFDWRKNPDGALAEVILLDQFSRNVFRDTAQAFAYDSVALVLAQVAVEKGLHLKMSIEHRCFLFMPYMHSESVDIHDIAVELITEFGDANTLDFELQHKAIIDRFGRYPHRNHILGRPSTEEEIAFLKQPNSGF